MEETAEYWRANLKDRRIVSGFLHDKDIGAKRLCSMPDRVTNTINTTSDAGPSILLDCRLLYNLLLLILVRALLRASSARLLCASV